MNKMLDLYKLFNVKEGEEFKIEYKYGYISNIKYRVINNQLESSLIGGEYDDCSYSVCVYLLNRVAEIKNIIKLPKKKEFTDDELCILRNIDKEYKWIAKDRDGDLWIYTNKPKKEYDRYWKDCSSSKSLSFEPLDIFKNSLFNSIQWEDEEPVFIDDYVNR